MTNYLTKTKTLMGVNFTKEVVLEAYGKAVVMVHAVPDVALTAIQFKLNYGIFDALKDLMGSGFAESDVDALMENKTVDLTKLAKVKLPASLMSYLAELGRAGIVPVPDPECLVCHGIQTGTAVCPACDTRKIVDDLKGFSTLEIGAAVLGASTGDWKEIEDFFDQKRAQSGQESQPSRD